jgi:hypothetical protein
MSSDNVKEANIGKAASDKQRAAATVNGKKRLGTKVSEETRARMSASHLGKKSVSVTRAKSMLGIKWWNNGVTAVRARECPPGYTRGRSLKRYTSA